MDESNKDFLTSFAKIKDRLIASNESAYNKYRRYWTEVTSKSYTPEEIVNILDSGSLFAKQQLSRSFFKTNSFYRQIVLYHATLLKYTGILIPHPSFGKKLSTAFINKRYYQALDFVEDAALPVIWMGIALKALVEGTYYGIILPDEKRRLVLMDLPFGYCRTRFKDIYGNSIIEFNVTYFDTIVDEAKRKDALALYPKDVRNAYRAYKRHGANYDNLWVIISATSGFCFTLFDGVPNFIGLIPAAMQYEEAIKAGKDRDAEEIKKIIVQQIPHLADGRLLFEPDEALEIHEGAVGMMSSNPNVSVLTTYADVDSVQSEGISDAAKNSNLKQALQNIYSKAGTSSELFASTGSTTLQFSLTKDLALMMALANQFSVSMTNLVNDRYSNTNISFKYEILPISYFNANDFTKTTLSLANSGYSFLLPALGVGLTQRDLSDIKQLENDVLKLSDLLIPLTTAYTQSANGSSPDSTGGRPKLETTEKTEQTIKNEESQTKTVDEEGGSE